LVSLTKRRVPAAAALVNAELSILLTDNQGIRKLNKKWRKKDKPTDVLSFPLHSVQGLKFQKIGAEWQLGDVIISLERAREQAKEKGVNFHKELRWLLAHGILHLLGYDHEISLKEAKRMRALERALLTP
jgi:probable rRNA maturation factor